MMSALSNILTASKLSVTPTARASILVANAPTKMVLISILNDSPASLLQASFSILKPRKQSIKNAMK